MQSNRKVTVSVTNRTIVRTILWIILAILAFRFMGRITHVLILIFISFFLALALNPAVSWMQKRMRVNSRVQAAGLTFLSVVVVVVAVIALVTPPLVSQTRDFIRDVPQTVQNFQQQDSGVARLINRYNIDDKLSQGAKDFTSHYSEIGSTALNTGKRIVEALVSVLVVLVITFMMLVEGPYWIDLFWKTLPEKKRERYQKNSHGIYRAVTGFVNGQVILAIVAGIFAFVALEVASNLLNVSINPLALAGIVTLLGIIPLFGNPLAATIVVLACLLNSVTLAVVMLIYFLVYFFIENHTFQPYIQSKLNQLTPLSVLIAALIGVGFAGFLGAIIAIPAASTIKILLEDHYKRQREVQAS